MTDIVKPEKSDASPTDKIAEALSKAQAKIRPPVKKRIVDFVFQNKRTFYKYADLTDIIDAIRDPLAENGLAIIHRMEPNKDLGYGMITELLHTSGQKLSSWYPLPDPGAMKPQEFGAELTYARRYSIGCLVGVSFEDANDSAAPSKAAPQATTQSKPQGAMDVRGAVAPGPAKPIVKNFAPQAKTPLPPSTESVSPVMKQFNDAVNKNKTT